MIDSCPWGPSDCAPVEYEYLMRAGNTYFIETVIIGEEGGFIQGQRDISTEEADRYIEENLVDKCRDCGRDLEGYRDYQHSALCCLCAGVRLEERGFPEY